MCLDVLGCDTMCSREGLPSSIRSCGYSKRRELLTQKTQRHISEEFEASSTPLYENQVSHFLSSMYVKQIAPTCNDFDEIWRKTPSFRHCYETRTPSHCHKNRLQIFSLWLHKRWPLWDESLLLGTLYILYVS